MHIETRCYSISMQRYRVAVLRGGQGEEYDVSLRTGEHVLEALDRDLYDPLDIVITKSGEWLHQGRARAPQEVLGSIDLGFIALHGAYGEDGSTQRFFDTMHVPYTGSRAFPSAIALNKALTKDKLASLGIRMPRHMLVGSSARANTEGLIDSIGELFGPKYVLKPVRGSSSTGISIAENKQTLYAALGKALSEYEQILVEEFIEGREATCGVINDFRDQPLYALPVTEIVPSQAEICPGRFALHEKEEIERIARLVHEVLELSQYSRSDFIVARDGIYFLEVNTLPELAIESVMPKVLESVGCAYKNFIHHLVDGALENSRR